MQSTQLALLAFFFGLVIGSGIVAMVFSALRARDRARAAGSTSIPAAVREVLRGLEDAVVVVDTSLTVRAGSPAAANYGLREGYVVPTDELAALARASRTTGSAAEATLRLRRGQVPADLRTVSARVTPISPRLLLVVARDITEQERLEEMRRDFVANTSHELKTPVGAVSLLAEAIESASDDPPQVRAFTARLTAEAARLAELTSRIMSLSRLQSADEIATMRDAAVDEIVAAAMDAHAILAQSAGVEIIRGGERGLYVFADPQILSDAVGNLIANAIAYSPTGTPVGIGVKAAGGVIEISVTDRGIGIAESDQERVFERFYRADPARARRTGGSGLGLSIVKHAVQRHGGEVRLWSRPGQGSTFTIRVPQIDAPADVEVIRPRRVKRTPVAEPTGGGSTNGDTE